MSLFNIEKSIMETMKRRIKVETYIRDTDEELVMINVTTFDGQEIYRHEYDLEPLIEAISKRL